MTFTSFYLISLLLFSLSTAIGPCYPGCKFYLSSSVGFTQEYAVAFGEAGRPFTNVFHDSNERVIGKVHNLAEAYNVDTPTRPIRISAWRPRGLNQTFNSNFFQPVSFPNTLFSGVTHARVNGNQKKFLNNHCWVLPITDYTSLITRNRSLVKAKRLHPSNTFRDCVAIKTFTF